MHETWPGSFCLHQNSPISLIYWVKLTETAAIILGEGQPQHRRMEALSWIKTDLAAGVHDPADRPRPEGAAAAADLEAGAATQRAGDGARLCRPGLRGERLDE